MTYNEWIMELFQRYKQEQLMNRYVQNGQVSQLDCIAVIQKYLRLKGILAEQDVLFGNEQMERRHLARIAHEFMRKELGELDEPNWERALELKDLYDCKICVNHVAQMYAKGIMGESSTHLFDLRKKVSNLEARTVIERIFSKEKRIRFQGNEATNILQNPDICLDAKAARKIMEDNSQCLFIDVNPGTEFLDTIFAKKSIHIPLAKLLNAPQMIPRNPGESIYLYCENGYQSEMAKNALRDYGYENVYSFGIYEGKD